MRINKYSKILFLFILIGGFLLRLNHLTDRSLWFDEAFSWRLIQFPITEFFQRAAADVHPVLYYIILWLWSAPLSFFGINLSLFWLRFLSVTLSVATIVIIYFAGKKLFKSVFIGLCASLLAAVSAFQIQYAWEARMYALGTLLLVTAFYLLLKIEDANNPKKIWGYASLLGLTIGAFYHVHYFALFSIAAIYAYIALVISYRLIKNFRNTIQINRTWAYLIAIIVSILIFLPWLPIFLKQRAQVQQSYWIPPMNNWSIPNTMSRLILGGTSDFTHKTAIICTIIVGIIIITPLIFGRKKGDLLLVLSFTVPFIGTWWLSRGTSIYQDRYFVFSSLALILLAARTINFLPKKYFIRSSVAILVAAYGLYSVIQFWNTLNFRNHPGTVAAVKHIEEGALSTEPIIVSSSFVYFPVAFHLPSGIRYGIAKNTTTREIQSPKLYSESGELSHFGGGPILTKDDIIGPEVFNQKMTSFWVIDTTGFGGSKLAPPDDYIQTEETSFSELFGYQGDIIVRRYVNK